MFQYWHVVFEQLKKKWRTVCSCLMSRRYFREYSCNFYGIFTKMWQISELPIKIPLYGLLLLSMTLFLRNSFVRAKSNLSKQHRLSNKMEGHYIRFRDTNSTWNKPENECRYQCFDINREHNNHTLLTTYLHMNSDLLNKTYDAKRSFWAVLQVTENW